MSCRFPRERAVTARSRSAIRNGRTFDATAEALHERQPLFAPGAPREAYFEGRAQLADLSDEEHSEGFIKNDNFFVE